MRYAGAAGESVNEIRLSPTDNGRQRVEWSHVRVEPAAELFGHIDAFGTRVCWFQLVGDHERLVVESEAIVLTKPAGAIVPLCPELVHCVVLEFLHASARPLQHRPCHDRA